MLTVNPRWMQTIPEVHPLFRMKICQGFMFPLLVLAAAVLAAPAAARTAPFLPRTLLSMPDPSIELNVSTNYIEYSGEYVTVSWSGVAVRCDLGPRSGSRSLGGAAHSLASLPGRARHGVWLSPMPTHTHVQLPAPTDMLAMYLAHRDPATSLPMKYIWTSLSETVSAPGSGSYR